MIGTSKKKTATSLRRIKTSFASMSRPVHSAFITSTRRRIIGLPAMTALFIRLEGLLVTVLLTRRGRSEEHTSEIQSRQYLACRLLVEKKKQHNIRDAQRRSVPSAETRAQTPPAL